MKRIKKFSFLICFIAFSFLFTGVLNLFAPTAEAVVAMPQVHSHIQQDGTVVYYQVHGDEFFHYMTDSNGDLVAFAQDGDLYFARWTDNNSSDYHFTEPTITKIVGAVNGSRVPSIESMRSLKSIIPQYHLHRAQNMRDERDRMWMEQFKASANVMQTTRGVTEGKVLMIYVSFANNGGKPSMSVTKPTSSTLYNMMFNENTFGTVAHYYKTVTNSAASIKPAATINTPNQGIVFVQLPGPHGNWGSANINDPRNDLIIPALRQAANSSNPGGYVNYAAFDKNGDRNISTSELSIGLIVHGYETSNMGGVTDPNFPSIWGHSWGVTTQNINGVYLSPYFVQGAFHNTQNPRLLTMGIIAHELGHNCFGFRDLYDVGGVSYGVGKWSLMGQGSWGGSPLGSSPTAIDAYHLYGGNSSTQLVAPKPVVYGTNTLTGLTQYVKLETSDPNQYFLVQPRGEVGYDRGLLDGSSWASWNSYRSGLLFWLVDDNLSGSNNLASNNHYHVVPLPATRTSSQYSSPYSTIGLPNELFTPAKPSITQTSTPSTSIYASTSSVYPYISSGWSFNSITSYVTNAGTNYGTVGGTFYAAKAPTITTAALSAGTVGTYYSQLLSANGTAPISWSINGGSFPPGLSFSSTGIISGTPTTVGSFSFAVKATNSVGTEQKFMNITINSSPSAPIVITTPSELPSGFSAFPYEDVQLSATGAGPITWSIDSGYFPDGLSLSSSGLISGTLYENGGMLCEFVIRATNAIGSVTKAFSIAVDSIQPAPMPKKPQD